MLRFAASKPLVFAPGSEWEYSSTNYIALGLVIEKVTGHPFGQELQQSIFKPLALSRTELATTWRLPDLQDQGVNPNLPWAAGGIVSDAQYLARFFSALLSGHLVVSIRKFRDGTACLHGDVQGRHAGAGCVICGC